MKRLIIALVALLPFATHAADTLYVQSTKAKVLANPSFQSDVLTTANKGAELTLVEKNDQWVKVTYQAHTGWVSALLVSDKPPQGKVTVIKSKDDAAQKEGVRRRASASASAAAARGLREDQRARVSDESHANYGALEKVEATKVDPKEVDDFAKGAQKQ